MKRSLTVLGAALLLLPLALAEGDWLVTRDGSRIETRGAWKVEGRLVRFTRTNGSLASLRVADVDLEASRRLTEAGQAKARPQAEKPAEETKGPVMVLTDADFSHPQGRGADEAEDAAASTATGGLSVVSWADTTRTTSNGVEFTGTVRNDSNQIAAQTSVTARLYDETGTVIATRPAVLNSPAVAPGGITNFRVAFPDIFNYGDVKFEVAGVQIEIKPPPPGAPPAPPPAGEQAGSEQGAAEEGAPPPPPAG